MTAKEIDIALNSVRAAKQTLEILFSEDVVEFHDKVIRDTYFQMNDLCLYLTNRKDDCNEESA